MDKITILFLAANPASTSKLSLDEEIHAITEKIYASEYRDYIKLESYWAIRPDDLLQAFNRYAPHIVHFSGHSTDTGGLVLVGDDKLPKVVNVMAIKALFQALKENIRVVFLNACYSQIQAEAIIDVIDCAIGMNDEIGDEAAILFSASFYRALGFGKSVQNAFDQGKAALQLAGIVEENTPELLVKKDVDPSKIVLMDTVQSSPNASPSFQGLSGKEIKRERIFKAYKVILNAAEEYQSVLQQLGYILQGETEETRNRRLNTALQEALQDVNDAMITVILEDVSENVETLFREIRSAFHSYAMSLETNTQFHGTYSHNDLTREKNKVIDKIVELRKAMQIHLKELES